MFEKLGLIVQRNSREILVVEIFITLLLVINIPSHFKFESDLNKFFPDTDETSAHDRVMENFGHDPSTYFVYVRPKNGDNVLAPDALKEELLISKAIEDISGIDGSISFALIVENVYRMMDESGTLPTPIEYQEEKDLDNATDDEINKAINMTATVLLNPELAEWIRQEIANNSNPEIAIQANRMNPEDLSLISSGLLPKDFDWFEKSANSTLILIWVNGSFEPPIRQEIALEVQSKLNDLDLFEIEIHQTSADLLAADVDEITFTSNSILGAGILGLICLILYITFKKKSYVLLPIITVFLAIIWTVGAMIMAGVVFNAIDVAVVPLIVGLGVDDSVHLARRYQEELAKGHKPAYALVKTIDKIGAAIFLTSLTTVVAFMSNMFSAVGPIRDFGLICAAGITFAFVLTVTFQAALRYELDRRKKDDDKLQSKGAPKLDAFMEKGANLIDKRPAPIVALVIILLMGSIYGSMYVRTDFRVEDFLPDDWETVKTYEYISADFEAASQSRVYVLFEGDIGTVDALEAIDSVATNIEDDSRLVSIKPPGDSDEEEIPKIFSIINYISEVLGSNHDQWEGLNDTERENFTHYIEIYNFNLDGTPDSGCSNSDVRDMFEIVFNDTIVRYRARTVLQRKLIDGEYEYRAAAIKIFVNARSETSDANAVYVDLKEDIKGSGFKGKVNVAGYVISTWTTIKSIQESQIQSTQLSIIMAAIILMFIFRSFILGILSIIPVAISAMWILGTMSLTQYMHNDLGMTGVPDVSLNVLTVMVTALTIGLGVDYSIHIIERFREEMACGDVRASIHTTIVTSGSAIFVSVLTTFAGFIILLASPMPITQHFGLITSLTMVYSFFLGVFTLPIFLRVWANWDLKRKAEAAAAATTAEAPEDDGEACEEPEYEGIEHSHDEQTKESSGWERVEVKEEDEEADTENDSGGIVIAPEDDDLE